MELFEGVIDDERGVVMGGDWPFFRIGLIWSSKRALLRIGQINVPRVCMKSGASFNTRSLFSPHFHP